MKTQPRQENFSELQAMKVTFHFCSFSNLYAIQYIYKVTSYQSQHKLIGSTPKQYFYALRQMCIKNN